MRKLKLDVEALHVESFTTSRAQARPGTVRAHDSATDLSCYQSCDCPWIDLTTACPLPTDDCSDDPSCDVCVSDRCAGQTQPGQRVCM